MISNSFIVIMANLNAGDYRNQRQTISHQAVVFQSQLKNRVRV